jgi:hypothetical protein
MSIDRSNRIHAVVGGSNNSSALSYFTSLDGTNWVTQFLGYSDRTWESAVIVLDRNDVPAVAYLTSDGLYFSQRSPDGTWNSQLVRGGSWYDPTVQNLTLAFDQSNHPTIAVYDPCSRSVLAMTPSSTPRADRDLLLFTKTIPPSPISPGTLLPYTFSTRNLSARDAHNVRLTVTFPTTVTVSFTSIAPLLRTGNSMAFSLRDLASFCGSDVEVQFAADRLGAFAVTASVTSDEPDTYPENNALTNVVELRPDSCFPPVSGAVARWPGDSDARDVLNGLDGTLRGDVAFTNGIIGQAFSLNGTNAYIQVRNGPEFNPAGSFAISTWIKQRGGGTVFGKYECGGGYCRGNALYAFSLSAGSLYFVVRDSAGGLSEAAAKYDFSPPRFYHVVCARDLDANELRVFVDGTMVTNVSLAGGATGPVRDVFVSDGDDPLLIGAFPAIQAVNSFF